MKILPMGAVLLAMVLLSFVCSVAGLTMLRSILVSIF